MSLTPFTRDMLPPALGHDTNAYDELAFGFARIAVAAGVVVMDVYNSGATVRTKSDSSPVCDADERAEALIQIELQRFAPTIPVLAEEAASRGEVPEVDGRFILVDPVDGTKEFLRRNGEFTINIALVEQGVPKVGAVYAPAIDKLWFAGDKAYSCTVEPGGDLGAANLAQIRSREVPDAGLTVMTSRSHADPTTEHFLSHLPVAGRQAAGSSLKFCALAEGQADLYPRFGPTMEWDTAAGDAVLRAAGGIILAEDGSVFAYGKAQAGFRNGGFVAWGSRSAAERWMPIGMAA